MAERGLPIVDGAPACPFVAFADDRDERASSPDHRHRCYAEEKPAPRALAHQEAYCLASAFPVCPTFQDWARREAARPAGGGGAIAAAGTSDDLADTPQRNPPRSWSAPPPWAGGPGSGPGGQGGAEAPGIWDDENAEAADDERGGRRGEPGPGRGLSGSYADRLASGGPVAEGSTPGGPGPGSTPPDRPAASPSAGDWDDDIGGPDARRYEADPRAPRHRERDDRGGQGGDDDDRRPGPRRDSAAPDWERPRRIEAYPTLRSRRFADLSIPPLLVSVVAIVLAAAILFALPGLLGFGNPQSAAPGSPSLPVQTGVPASPGPATPSAATPQLYTVQQGDTMSSIADQFNVPLGDLIAANTANIPDPDKLQIGDQVIIPVPVPSSLPGASAAPAAS
jgi:hypothetical protein